MFVNINSQHSVDRVAEFWLKEVNDIIKKPIVLVSYEPKSRIIMGQRNLKTLNKDDITSLAEQIYAVDHVHIVENDADCSARNLFNSKVINFPVVAQPIVKWISEKFKNEEFPLIATRIEKQRSELGLRFSNVSMFKPMMLAEILFFENDKSMLNSDDVNTMSFRSFVKSIDPGILVDKARQMSFFSCSLSAFEAFSLKKTYLEDLKVLILMKNTIKRVHFKGCLEDKNLFILHKLEELYLGYNNLSKLKPDISFLINLKILDLRANKFRSIPDEIFKLINLEKLDLSENKLDEFDCRILDLTNLRVLKHSSNGLRTIPENISQLVKLEELVLIDNAIVELPSSIRLLDNLVRIDIDKNPIKEPPPLFVSKGVDAMKNFFTCREAYGDIRTHVKILFFGSRGCGKTLAMRRTFKQLLKSHPDHQYINGIIDGDIMVENVHLNLLSETRVSFVDLSDSIISCNVLKCFADLDIVVLAISLDKSFNKSHMISQIHYIKYYCDDPYIIIYFHTSDLKLSQKAKKEIKDIQIMFKNIEYIFGNLKDEDDQLYNRVYSYIEGASMELTYIPRIYNSFEMFMTSTYSKDQTGNKLVYVDDMLNMESFKPIKNAAKDISEIYRCLSLLNMNSPYLYYGHQIEAMKNTIILDPQVLTDLLFRLSSIRINDFKDVISIEELLSIVWRSPGISQEEKLNFLGLLEHIGIIIKLPDNKFISSLILFDELPDGVNWPSNTEALLARNYSLKFIHPNIAINIALGIMDYVSIQCIWKKGIIFSTEGERKHMGRILFNEECSLVDLKLIGESWSDIGVLICALETLLIKDFSVSLNDIALICPVCINTPEQCKSNYMMTEIMNMLRNDTVEFKCRNHTIHIPSLLPELYSIDIPPSIFCRDEVSLKESIGHNGTSQVSNVQYRDQPFLLKEFSYPYNLGNDGFCEFRNEITMSNLLYHPNITQVSMIKLEKPYALLIESSHLGNLKSLILTGNEINRFSLVLKIAWDVALAMHQIHDRIGRPHGDLKTSNIHIESLNELDPVVAKVSNLGKCFYTSDIVNNSNPAWLAPELLFGNSCTCASDVYSYGLVLWQMHEKKMPFNECKFGEDIISAICSGDRPKFSAVMCEEYEQLVYACWNSVPELRPSFREILDKFLPSMILKFS